MKLQAATYIIFANPLWLLLTHLLVKYYYIKFNKLILAFCVSNTELFKLLTWHKTPHTHTDVSINIFFMICMNVELIRNQCVYWDHSFPVHNDLCSRKHLLTVPPTISDKHKKCPKCQESFRKPKPPKVTSTSRPYTLFVPQVRV